MSNESDGIVTDDEYNGILRDDDPVIEGAPLVMPEPQGVRHARLFCECEELKPLFLDAERDKLEVFKLPISAFDDWIIRHGLIPGYDQIPDTEDKVRWNHFTTQRNKIRVTLNKAASVGRHGEPPYSIDTPKTDIEVRDDPTPRQKALKQKGTLRKVRRTRKVRTYYEVHLVAGLARITHKDAVSAVESLLRKKVKDFEAQAKTYAVYWHQLPMQTRFALDQQSAEVDMVSETMSGMLNRLLVRIQENHERASAFIERVEAEEKAREAALQITSPGSA